MKKQSVSQLHQAYVATQNFKWNSGLFCQQMTPEPVVQKHWTDSCGSSKSILQRIAWPCSCANAAAC